MLRLICSWHCSHRATDTGAACLSCHLKLQTDPGKGGACQTPLAALLRRCERLQIAGRQKWPSWKAVAQPHLPMALLAQRHRDLGLLASLASSNFQRSLGMGDVSQARFTALLRKSKRLQIAGRQKGLAWKAVAQPHLPMALLAQSQGVELLACLATSNFKRSLGMGCVCQARFAALLRKSKRLQIAGSQKGLAWKAVAQPHLPMALLAQRHRHWGCLLVSPPQTSIITWEWWVPARLHLQPCSKDANVCR